MARFAGDAIAASAAPVLATGSTKTDDHAIADRDTALGAGTEGFDDTDSFMSERAVAGGEGPIAASEMKIGMTHAARAHAEKGLIRSRYGSLALTNLEGSVDTLH